MYIYTYIPIYIHVDIFRIYVMCIYTYIYI